ITHRSSSVPVSILVSLMSPAFLVIARREATKQSRSVGTALDCFAEPVIGPRFARTRWLAMTVSSKLLHPRPQFHFPGPGALRLLQHVPVAQGYRIGIEPGVGAIRWILPRGAADAAVDHKMRDMNALGRQFARQRLREAAQRELAHREGR